MDKNSLKHRLIFGKNRKAYIIAFIILTAVAAISGLFQFNLVIIFGACAFTVLVMLIIDITNVKRFGSFYAIDVIDNQIIEISEKNGERIVRPDDIVEIVQPKDLNLTNPERINKNELFLYIKLKDGKTLGISGVVSDYDELAGKIKLFAEQNNLKERCKITGIL